MTTSNVTVRPERGPALSLPQQAVQPFRDQSNPNELEVSDGDRSSVCGMKVNEKDAAGKVNYQGREYYFCSHECEGKFKEEPEKFVKAA